MKIKEIIRSVALGLLIVISMFSVVKYCSENVAASTTWTVNDQGGADFTRIRDAIQVAAPGDSIDVSYGSGFYNENNPLVIDKSLTINGQITGGGFMPSITAQNSGYDVFQISGAQAKPVHIENFHISGATGNGKAGIYSNVVGNSTDFISFQNLRITGNDIGIFMTTNTRYHFIDDCYVYSNNGNGIVLNGQNHQIEDCGSSFAADTGIFSNGGDGIYSSGLSTSTIESSNIYNNDQNGINIMDGYENTIQETEIWNNDCRGLYLCGNSNTINGLTRNIKNNYYNCVTSGLNDVYIYGRSNTISDYHVYQTNENLDQRTGIYVESDSSAWPNTVSDCVVYGYEGEDSVGILARNSDITGSATNIHDNDIGVDLGCDCLVDCDSSFTSENLDTNLIGILVGGDNCNIVDTYIAGTGALSQIGIRIPSESGDGDINAYIENCQLDQLGKGIYISGSDTDDNSVIADSRFNSCYDGIYISSGEHDDIGLCIFTGGNTGIYLDSSSNIDITSSNFYDHRVGGSGPGTKDAGVYGYNSDDNYIAGCLFDNDEKSIWFEYYSTSNVIYECQIKDGNGSAYDNGQWGENDAEIGVYFDTHSDYCDILQCDFTNIRYAIGVEASEDIDIIGDSEAPCEYSIISGCGVSGCAIYATNQDSSISSGEISYYGQVNSVSLTGYNEEIKTVFSYSNLYGNWPASGSYSNWIDLD